MDKMNNQTASDLLYRILDSIDAYIYVSDPGTNEILYINKNMDMLFGGDLKGKICWKVLQKGMTKACSFCPNKKLLIDPKTPVVWEELNLVTNHYYRNTDTIIEWHDGRQVHIQHSVDITDIKNAELARLAQYKQQKLLSAISMEFSSKKSLDEMIKNSLMHLGIHYKLDRSYILKENELNKKFSFAYEWHKDGVESIMNRVGNYETEYDLSFYNTINEGKPLLINFKDPASRNFVKIDEKVFSSIATPLMIGGKLWGILGMDSIEVAQSPSPLEIEHIRLITNIISSGLERKSMEINLLNTEQYLRTLIDAIPLGLYWKSVNNVYTGCNTKFANYMNTTADQIIGKDAKQLSISRGLAPHIADDTNLMKSGKSIIGKEIYLLNNNEKTWYRMSKVPVTDINGEINSLIGCIEDITVIKKNEEALLLRDRQLEESVRIAERANSAKSEFLSRMSHEIRTPMNAIIGMTYIAKGFSDVEKIKNCLDKIDGSSKHLLAIINDILDMSKIEADKLDLFPEEFNLEKLLIEICNIVSVKLDERKQNLHVNIAKDVATFYKGDALRFSQIISNLLTNAIKFSPEKSDIKLEIKSDKMNDKSTRLLISVQDQGIGIPLDKQKNLFTPFEQADGGIARKFGGTGLGLAICKRIINLMGGNISVSSIENAGSTFSFDIILENVSRQDHTEISSSINKENLRVLVVDDSIEVLDFFSSLMMEYGISTSTALSGEVAIKMVAEAEESKKPFNIIFMDWRMPGINGIETSRIIKQKYNKDTFVILISIAEWSSIEKIAKESGIMKFLSKPLFPSSIIDAINEVLGVKKIPSILEQNQIPEFNGKRILLAEDVEINVEILRALLANTHAEIISVENGKMAVETFMKNDNFDLILMDIHMPVMDGYEATKLLRNLPTARAKSIPIVAMTANVFQEDIDRCKAAGMNDHIAKPIEEKILLKKLSLYLLPTGGKSGMSNENNVNEQYKEYFPYIDVNDGLSRLRGNKKLYAKLMKSYISSVNISKIVEQLNANELAGAQDTVHSLKGISANLSIMRMFELSRELESAIKEVRDTTPALFSLKKTLELTIPLINKLIAELEQ